MKNNITTKNVSIELKVIRFSLVKYLLSTLRNLFDSSKTSKYKINTYPYKYYWVMDKKKLTCLGAIRLQKHRDFYTLEYNFIESVNKRELLEAVLEIITACLNTENNTYLYVVTAKTIEYMKILEDLGLLYCYTSNDKVIYRKSMN